jgi:hypothetical protein
MPKVASPSFFRPLFVLALLLSVIMDSIFDLFTYVLDHPFKAAGFISLLLPTIPLSSLNPLHASQAYSAAHDSRPSPPSLRSHPHSPLHLLPSSPPGAEGLESPKRQLGKDLRGRAGFGAC